jgi:hypothetical protein
MDSLLIVSSIERCIIGFMQHPQQTIDFLRFFTFAVDPSGAHTATANLIMGGSNY